MAFMARISDGKKGDAELTVQSIIAMSFRAASCPEIHEDFRLRSGLYSWNGRWGRPHPEKKICFYFNDPKLLDNCPFVCKVAINTKPDKPYEYFGVAYGPPPSSSGELDFESMRDWASRFDFAGVYSYGYRDEQGKWVPGELLEMITQEAGQ